MSFGFSFEFLIIITCTYDLINPNHLLSNLYKKLSFLVEIPYSNCEHTISHIVLVILILLKKTKCLFTLCGYSFKKTIEIE